MGNSTNTNNVPFAIRYMPYASLILAFLGFLDATYLTILHYKHIIPPCTISGSKCETVLTSQYATMYGIPIALLGSLFYVTVMILLGLLLQVKNRHSGKAQSTDSRIPSKAERGSGRATLARMTEAKTLSTSLLILTSTGLLVSAILVYLQGFVIHAYCQYCLTSEGINTLLFIFVFFLWRKK